LAKQNDPSSQTPITQQNMKNPQMPNNQKDLENWKKWLKRILNSVSCYR